MPLAPLLMRPRTASRNCTLPSPRVILPFRSRMVTPSTSRDAIVRATENSSLGCTSVIASPPGRVADGSARNGRFPYPLERDLGWAPYVNQVLSPDGARRLTRVNSVPGCRWRKCTSSMKERMRKMPRPVPRMRFSGSRGSGSVAGSTPLPWSQILKTSSEPVFSKLAVICLEGSYSLPWRTALTAASRTAMVTRKVSSSSSPASEAIFSAAASTSPTLSIVELSEKENFPGLEPLTGIQSASSGAVGHEGIRVAFGTMVEVSWVEVIVSRRGVWARVIARVRWMIREERLHSRYAAKHCNPCEPDHSAGHAGDRCARADARQAEGHCRGDRLAWGQGCRAGAEDARGSGDCAIAGSDGDSGGDAGAALA